MASLITLCFALMLLVCLVQAAKLYRPVVLWHGMGDNCCNPDSMGKIKEIIEESLPGIYVHSIMLGTDEEADRKASYFGNVNEQVAEVCKTLRGDKKLKNGFNAIGFSQGGLFLRSYIERCNDPPVYNLITFGSPHQGVSDIPGCENNDYWCFLMRNIVRRGVYSGYVRNHIVSAQYYKDPDQLDAYLENNIFLPDVNNELNINETYKENFSSLNKLVLVRFTEDVTLKPKDSAWFSFYNEEGELLDYYDTPLYVEDWIGLQKLDEEDQIDFLECEGRHMQIGLDFLQDEVIVPYLSEPLSKESTSIKIAFFEMVKHGVSLFISGLFKDIYV